MIELQMIRRTAAALWAIGILTGAVAAPAESNDGQCTTGEVWTIRRFQREFCGEDCWEPFNRSMFWIFDTGMQYVVDPFCYIYSSIVPKPLIQGVDNFGENLEYPDRCLSNLFMGEWHAAWDDTRRAVINTTIGIGGLFDPAENWFCIFDSEASLSDTFTRWGIPAGPQLALPFMPRATLRGHIGYLADYALDLKTWFDYLVPSGIFIGWSWCLTPNKAPVWRGGWETLFATAQDGYSIYMPLMVGMNDFNFRQYAWHAYESIYSRAAERKEAKRLPEGNEERARIEAHAETFQRDVRPAVHCHSVRPAGLKGRWRTIPGYAPRSPALDSLRALCYNPVGDDDFWWERRSIFNRDFSKRVETRKVTIGHNLPMAKFSFVPTEGAMRELVIILPGIGSGRTCSEAVAMAEELHGHGYGVVICDSLFHWDFVQSANRGILPGNIREDVLRYGDFLDKAIAGLKESGDFQDQPVSVVGWSMGGLTTTWLAALSSCGGMVQPVRRYVAINPPASMQHAIKPFEKVRNASRAWSRDYARRMFTEIAGALYGWASQPHPRFDPANPPKDAIGDDWNYAPNITDDQAKFLFGMTLNVSFPQLIYGRHCQKPFPWIKAEHSWFSRRAVIDEIGDVTMREYIERYVPNCYECVTAEEMVSTADISNLSRTLAGDRRIRVIHTRTDPLLTDADRAFLDDALGDRITWFDEGAHCGYFYTAPFCDELLQRLGED